MTILAFLIAIIVLVGFHEYGHYLVAKLCGVHVIRFSIGFGKILWRSKPQSIDQTEWVISAIPLGGYVKLRDGRDPNQVLEQEQYSKAFDHQVLWKRSLIVAAGPMANFLLALILLTSIYLTGSQQLKPVLGLPAVGTVAASLGVAEGDEVVSWRAIPHQNAQSIEVLEFEPINSWNRLRWKLIKSTMLKQSFGLELRTPVGARYRIVIPEVEFQLSKSSSESINHLGFQPLIKQPMPWFTLQPSLGQAIFYAADRVWDISVITVWNLKDLLIGQASLNQLSGPIAIADMAGKSAQGGIHSYLGFLAFISISLGLLNLLPLPMLDGGQLMYDLWELLFRRKVSQQIQGFLQRLSIVLLLLLTLLAFFNDVTHLLLK